MPLSIIFAGLFSLMMLWTVWSHFLILSMHSKCSFILKVVEIITLKIYSWKLSNLENSASLFCQHFHLFNCRKLSNNQVNSIAAEFIEKSHEMYQSLHQTQRSPRDPVVVPSGSDDTKVHQNSHHPGDGVDATQYFRAIYPLCDRSNFRYMYNDILPPFLKLCTVLKEMWLV